MDSKSSVVINNSPFPNQMATDAEKSTKEYGLKVAKAVEGEWFRKANVGSCRYYDQYVEFHKYRLYARGQQPTKVYKDLLAIDGLYFNCMYKDNSSSVSGISS